MKHVKREEFFVETESGIKLLVVSKVAPAGRLGKAALLIHGSGVGWIYWDIPIKGYSVMDYLVDRGIDVYAVECRGYGKSTKPYGFDVRVETMAEDLKRVFSVIREKSGVDKVSAVGHSSGGLVLMVAAGLRPDLLDRIVLVGTPYKSINPLFREYVVKVIQMAKESGKNYVPNLHYKDIENRLDTHDDEVVKWYKDTVEGQYPLMPGGILAGIIENPGAPFVPIIKIPTLIFSGAKEYVTELADAQAMFLDLATGDKGFIIQPDSFHLSFLEKRGHRGLQECIFFWITKS
jgi:pimeloyl-ACP methyl ester carboxylesterase